MGARVRARVTTVEEVREANRSAVQTKDARLQEELLLPPRVEWGVAVRAHVVTSAPPLPPPQPSCMLLFLLLLWFYGVLTHPFSENPLEHFFMKNCLV